MTTPSHLIMTLALHRRLKTCSIPKTAFILGAVIPDVALILLMSGGSLWYSIQQSWTLGEGHQYAMDVAYYTYPGWIIAYNLFHAPLVLGVLLILTWRHRWSQPGWRRALFWFASAASLHVIIDIGTHHSDGPLLLFPINWEVRFQSPFSYWDPRFYGPWIFGAELLLDLGLLIYLWRSRHHTNLSPRLPKGPTE